MNGDIAHTCAFRPDEIQRQKVNELFSELEAHLAELAAEGVSLEQLLAAYRATAVELEQLEATA